MCRTSKTLGSLKSKRKRGERSSRERQAEDFRREAKRRLNYRLSIPLRRFRVAAIGGKLNGALTRRVAPSTVIGDGQEVIHPTG